MWTVTWSVCSYPDPSLKIGPLLLPRACVDVGNDGEHWETTQHRRDQWPCSWKGLKSSSEEKRDDSKACSVVLAGFCGQEGVGNIALKRVINPYDLVLQGAAALVTLLWSTWTEDFILERRGRKSLQSGETGKWRSKPCFYHALPFLGFLLRFTSSSAELTYALVSSTTFVGCSGLVWSLQIMARAHHLLGYWILPMPHVHLPHANHHLSIFFMFFTWTLAYLELTLPIDFT